MTFLAAQVREHYERLGVKPRPGVAPSTLAAFETTHRLTLPKQVASFYLAIDGIDADVPDFGAHALQLWPLRELTRVTERVAEYRGIPDYGPIVSALADADEYVAFGDGMCWSHVLAFRLSPSASPVLWICGASYATIANDFEEFWIKYLENPDAVLWPTDEQIVSPAV